MMRLHNGLSWVLAMLTGAAFAVSPFFIGFNVHLWSVILVLLVAHLAMVLGTLGEQRAFVPRGGLALALVSLPAWLALSLVWSPVPSISHVTLWWALVPALVFWAFVLNDRGAETWDRTMAIVVAVGVGLAAYGIYQRFTLTEIPSGPFLDRNIYAALLAALAFPVAAWFLANTGSRQYLAGIAFFLLVFVAALTQSRSGLLTLLIASAAFAIVAWDRGRARRLAVLATMMVAAVVLANLMWSGEVADKLATLRNPNEAGHARFLIWAGTWRMIVESPWTGIGLGMYPLLWPPHRHPEDSSAGYFVHNDYLQMWVDAGLPALILFVGVLVAALWMIVRQWRATSPSHRNRAELAGIAASLTLLSANGFFNYNFYVIPSTIVLGLLLARLQMLDRAPERSIAVDVERVLSKRTWRVVVAVFALWPCAYFLSVAAASLITDRAVAAAGEGRYEAADADLNLARRFWPSAESILMLNADVYRHLLSLSRSTDMKQRAEVFEAAVRMLNEAEQLNPYRADIFLIRADLRRANSGLAADAGSAIERDYQRALDVDPWHYRARYQYGTYLLERRATDKARAVLEGGVSRAFALGREDIVPYLLLTAKLRQQADDASGAEQLVRQAKNVAESARAREQKRGERAGPLGILRMLQS